MVFWKRLVSTIGPRRVVATLGGLYIAFAAGRAVFELTHGVPGVNVAVGSLLVALPGLVLVYGAHRLARYEIDAEFYPSIAGWCLAGFSLMVVLLAVYHLQPGESVATRSPPILTALASAAGFAVGVHDGRAKTRTHELEAQNDELQQIRTELEETVTQLEGTNHRLERYRTYTDHVLDTIPDVFYVLEADGTLQRWNDSLCEVSGYSDAEIESMHTLAFFDEDEHELITDAIREGFETGRVQVEAELLTSEE